MCGGRRITKSPLILEKIVIRSHRVARERGNVSAYGEALSGLPHRRPRAAIAAFDKAHGYVIVDEFYDAAVSGADPIAERPGFKAMLDRIAANGVRCIIVESPFARDLTVQLTGHDFLKKLGIALIPATAPDFFTEDTPTAVLVRQVLGTIAQFEKTSLVAKLKAARDRKKAATGKCEGRKSYAEAKPETVALAKELHGQRLSAQDRCRAGRARPPDGLRQALRGECCANHARMSMAVGSLQRPASLSG
jgi:DNA invertase Pin-like site-specific DNA recombinase